jgi:hypothetical protein
MSAENKAPETTPGAAAQLVGISDARRGGHGYQHKTSRTSSGTG